MHAERAPLLGVALAVLMLLAEGIGLVAYRAAQTERIERLDASAWIRTRVVDPNVALLHEKLQVVDESLVLVGEELARLEAQIDPPVCVQTYKAVDRRQQELVRIRRELKAELRQLRGW